MSEIVESRTPMRGNTLPSLRRLDGKMTRELLLEPGQHGLGMTHDSLKADSVTTAVCGYCATGCGLRMHLKGSEAVGLTPETSYPVNLGMACPKGWEALRVLDSDDRATAPLTRNKSGQLVKCDWHTALSEFCREFKAIQSMHGNRSVAFLSTGQIACEEMAYLGALTKFGMGILHGDGNTRQCMATAVTAYKESFGFDAPPYTYDDFEQSDCLVFVGANPCISHPIMWERVLRNPNAPEIIVVDPRKTETATAATEHLRLRPKSDLTLLYAITREIIRNGLVDHRFIATHVNGYAELSEHVEPFTLELAEKTTGLSAQQIRASAYKVATSTAVSLWWTMGVNQSYEGVRTAQAIINIALITGNIGRPGTGANSITGQCNAMGSRLWSNTTNLLGHHRFESVTDREKVATALGIDADCIPSESGWTYDRIIEGIDRGEIRGLWVIATNPLHSWIDQKETQRLLAKLDYLVVQDMYHSTETAQHADLLLPAAGWGEKEGTFINSERRYGTHRRVRQAPGEALSDFRIFQALSHYWGVSEMFSEWTDPESVFRILQRLSADQPCDITGIQDYEQIDRCGGIQWPWTNADAKESDSPAQQRRLFSDNQFFTCDRRANLIVADITPMPDAPDDDFPMLLLTGRGTVSQWHTQTRTNKSPILRKLFPSQAYVEIHPDDARAISIDNGQTVRITSRQGEAELVAVVTPTVSQGTAFVPMHYPETNRLTFSHFDPYSKQPSYKNAAIKIQAVPTIR